jgi:hypothetical protein
MLASALPVEEATQAPIIDFQNLKTAGIKINYLFPLPFSPLFIYLSLIVP